MKELPIIDSFGRIHTNLRISVTDRCNIRCVYCMPSENVTFRPKHELLRFEEITRLTRIAASMGVNKLRITGGEPLVRAGLSELISQLSSIDGIQDIALTTNGMLLAEQAESLKAAGLRRLNVSLDGLSDEIFFLISRRRGVQRIIDGILRAARRLTTKTPKFRSSIRFSSTSVSIIASNVFWTISFVLSCVIPISSEIVFTISFLVTAALRFK